MLTKTKMGLAAFALVAFAGLAFGQGSGFWSNWPVVSGASYCATTTNGVCTATVPAGPTALTGNETLPANTGVGNGATANVLIKPASIGAGPYAYNAPLTGASITVAGTTRRLILEPAGTIAALTVVMPAAADLTDNQLFGLCTTQIVTALTVTAGSGTTVLNAPTAMLVPVATGAGSCVEWVYRVTNTSWYRVQ